VDDLAGKMYTKGSDLGESHSSMTFAPGKLGGPQTRSRKRRKDPSQALGKQAMCCRGYF
jgi:hypothetical protein